jgi:CRP-like cAMP-binding protein
VIVRENEPGDEFYVIGEGSVRVTRGGTELARIGTGGHFGELALVGSGQRAASVTAVTDCVLLAIGRHQLVDFLSYEPALGVKLLWRFLQNLGDQVRELSSDLIRYKR